MRSLADWPADRSADGCCLGEEEFAAAGGLACGVPLDEAFPIARVTNEGGWGKSCSRLARVVEKGRSGGRGRKASPKT